MKERTIIYLVGGAPRDRFVLSNCFGRCFELVCVRDGGEALCGISGRPGPVAALLIAEEAFAAYPGDLWRELRRRGLIERLPVFILATVLSPEREAAWLSAGAADVLKRPLFPPLIFQRVSRLVELYERRERLAADLEQQTRQLVRETRDLRLRAEQDCLTKLSNRGAVESEVAAFLSGAGRCGRHAFLLIDVDNFKQINDSLGHLRGDAVLRETAAQLRRRFRSDDIIGRIGGDEFVILMKNVTSQALAAKCAGEVCGIFHALSALRGTACTASGSIGIAMFKRDGLTYRELFHKADLALYAAKRRGKDSFYFYQSGLTEQGAGPPAPSMPRLSKAASERTERFRWDTKKENIG